MKAAFFNFFGETLRPFQEEVAQAILGGTPTVLRAPTGYGKTAAAQFPFFLARQENLDFPRQMLYTLPLRVLANSLRQDAAEQAQKCGLKPQDVLIQTGEFPQDNLFLGDLTFTTYDQLLSGFLHFPLSTGAANILPGAAISSYLAFDEVHLMEAGRALGTTVAMLQWLQGVTPALLMTATLTDGVLDWLQSELNARVVQLPAAEIANLPRARRWHREKGLLDAGKILEKHAGKRTIVVANTVDSAQRIFSELRQKAPAGTEVILLHSRFFQAHRKQKEELLLRLFGKGAQGSTILVATQVIEVGINISCDNLHTELAPANSLIQRAGRCARFENETGDVWVYDAPFALPYSEELSTATDTAESALWNYKENGEAQTVGYKQELEWVEAVHGAADKKAVDALTGRKARIFEVIANNEKGVYTELVRQIDTLSVAISPAPEELRQPWDLEGLSIRPGTLEKNFKALAEPEWFAKKPHLKNPEKSQFSERREPPQYNWPKVENGDEFKTLTFVVLNPRHVSYSEDVGLRFEPHATGESGLSPCVVRRQRERYSYRRETYLQHITQVWKACERHFLSRGRLQWAARCLEEKCGLQSGDFERLLRLVIALHDAGKLSQEWQNAVWNYQKECWNDERRDFLAHTLYNPADPRQYAIGKWFSRPPHAAESAVLTQAVWESLGFDEPIACAAYSAIARHHAPFIGSVSEQKLANGAVAAIIEAAQACGAAEFNASDIALMCRRDDVLDEGEWLLQPATCPNAFLLYLLVVRVLRISDRFSFEEA